MTGGYQYGGEDPPGASSAAGTTANPPAGGVTQTVGAASVQPGATVDPSGGVTRTAVQQPVQAQQQQAQQQQQQQQQQVQSGVAESGVQPSQQVPAPSAPPAPSRLSAESGVAPSAVSEKLLKFRSSNLIVLSNIEVNGKKYGVALAFRKQNSNGSFVLSPYCKLDLPKNGEQVSEANLFAAAKKSIEMASSGAIKLNV
jgi:hemolysin activation/secretion protein